MARKRLDNFGALFYTPRMLDVDVRDSERPPAAPAVGAFVLACNDWRHWLRLSHQEFARMLGRTPSEWSLYVNGRRQVSASFVAAVRDEAKRRGGKWLAVLANAYVADAARDWNQPT